MHNKTYGQLVEKMHEVSLLPPQNFGRFSGLYHHFVPFLKESPWKVLAFAALFAGLIFYVLFGDKTIRLTSILQLGF